MKNFSKHTILGVVLGLILALIYTKFKDENIEYIVLDNSVSEFEIPKDSIYDFMEQINLKHPDIVYSQILIETGHFKDRVFKENNNLFGMKLATRRPVMSKKLNINHIQYPDSLVLKGWQLSLIDYAFFQARFCNFDNEDDYLNYLSDNYAENNKYVSLIKRILTNKK